MSFAAFEAEVGKLNDVLCAGNLLTWDARTMMPPSAAEARGRQLGTLAELARDIATGDRMLAATAAALREVGANGSDALHRRALDDAEAAIARLARIPASLVREAAELRAEAQPVWIRARAENHFALFAPVLERAVEQQRAIAQHVGFDAHPYDAACSAFEPGATWSSLRTMFADLKAGIAPLLERALAAPPARLDVLTRPFPIEKQKAFSRAVATRLGYDFARGRLDDTVHPFEISFTAADVRITGRFREDWLPGGLFAVWHEAGHGIYEQNVDPAFARTIFATDIVNLYAVGGASFGTHESQSRLFENRVCRSRQFWELNFGSLRDAFPDQLADVSAHEFWRAVNAARPSLIRVEADELTYDLHIILRAEIEAGLMDGSISVRDLPELWRAKMEELLGLSVPSDTLGVLQDVHWSSGLIGSFPTYTIGNVMASQLFAAARRDHGVESGLAEGDYGPLTAWLRANVHRHGRSRLLAEIVKGATGHDLSINAYLSDLSAKVAELAA